MAACSVNNSGLELSASRCFVAGQIRPTRINRAVRTDSPEFGEWLPDMVNILYQRAQRATAKLLRRSPTDGDHRSGVGDGGGNRGNFDELAGGVPGTRGAGSSSRSFTLEWRTAPSRKMARKKLGNSACRRGERRRWSTTACWRILVV